MATGYHTRPGGAVWPDRSLGGLGLLDTGAHLRLVTDTPGQHLEPGVRPLIVGPKDHTRLLRVGDHLAGLTATAGRDCPQDGDVQ